MLSTSPIRLKQTSLRLLLLEVRQPTDHSRTTSYTTLIISSRNLTERKRDTLLGMMTRTSRIVAATTTAIEETTCRMPPATSFVEEIERPYYYYDYREFRIRLDSTQETQDV